ncbi:MAG: hypothetical protein ACRC4L_02880 [Mycoplasma sp.]
MDKLKRWNIIWISESKYNYYEGVDQQKKRPVLIWSKTLFGRNYICFHCTTNKSNYESENLINIGKLENKTDNTFIFVDRAYKVKVKDIEIPNKLISLEDKKFRKIIKNKVKTLSSSKRFWRERNSKIKIVNK